MLRSELGEIVRATYERPSFMFDGFLTLYMSSGVTVSLKLSGADLTKAERALGKRTSEEEKMDILERLLSDAIDRAKS